MMTPARFLVFADKDIANDITMTSKNINSYNYDNLSAFESNKGGKANKAQKTKKIVSNVLVDHNESQQSDLNNGE